MVNTLTPCAASGVTHEASTPIWSNAKGPCSLSTSHPHSALAPAGVSASSQTIESSSAVRVTEAKPLASRTEAGIDASGASPTIA